MPSGLSSLEVTVNQGVLSFTGYPRAPASLPSTLSAVIGSGAKRALQIHPLKVTWVSVRAQGVYCLPHHTTLRGPSIPPGGDAGLRKGLALQSVRGHTAARLPF